MFRRFDEAFCVMVIEKNLSNFKDGDKLKMQILIEILFRRRIVI